MLPKAIIIILAIGTLSSCRTGLRSTESEVKILGKGFSARVQNKAFKETRKYYQHELNLLPLFSIRDHQSDSVDFFFIDQNKLHISFVENGEKVEKTFNGKFSKRGYFEILLQNEKLEIPPHFPIFDSRYNVERVQIGLTRDGCLVVGNFWSLGGNLLFITGGGKGELVGCFKFRALKVQ